MKRIMMFIMAAALLCGAVAGFSACDDEGKANSGHTEHTYGEWETVESPTCDKEGKRVHRCTECEHEEEEPIQKLSHTLTETTAKTATCTTDGNSAYWTCSGCGKYFSDKDGKTEIKKDSWIIKGTHVLTLTAEQAATCTTPGNTAYWTCSQCGKFFSDKDGQTEVTENSWVVTGKHKLNKVDKKEATCLPGVEEHYACETCNKLFVDAEGKTETTEAQLAIEATGEHQLGAKIEETAKTCTQNGEKAHYDCSICKKHFEDDKGEKEITDLVIPASHNIDKENKIEAKEPTCTKTGWKAHYDCQDCNKHFEDENGVQELTDENVTIAAKGHTAEDVPQVDATCTEPGKTAGKKCSVCQTVIEEGEEIPAKGHTYGDKIEKIEATCGAAGKKAYWQCSACNKFFVESESGDNEKTEIEESELTIPATGQHQWTENEGAGKAPTCTEPGTIGGKKCSVCGQTQDGESSPALGHIYEDGYKYNLNKHWKQCLRCGEAENVTTHTATSACNICGYASYKNIITGGSSNTTYKESGLGKLQENECVVSASTVSSSNVNFGFAIPDHPKNFIGKEDPNLTFTIIGENAFKNKTNLTLIYIPSTIRYIDVGAFEGCVGLEKIIFEEDPENTTPLYICSGAFKNCTSLKQLNLPKRVQYVGYGAFEGCLGLKEVNIYNGEIKGSGSDVTTLYDEDYESKLGALDGVFKGCTLLTKVVFKCEAKDMKAQIKEGCFGENFDKQNVYIVDLSNKTIEEKQYEGFEFTGATD